MVPYLIISTVLSLVPWIMLGLNETLRSSTWHLTILLTVQNLGSAMADVGVYAMIAEAVRFERASFAGDLQSMSWLAMAVGGICGSLLGGYALTNLPIDKMFLLFSVLPAMQFLLCGLVEENFVCSKRLPEVSVVKGYDLVNENGYKTTENRSTGKKSNISTSRRKKNQKNNKSNHH